MSPYLGWRSLSVPPLALAAVLTGGCGSMSNRQDDPQASTDVSNAELAIASASQSGAPDNAPADLFQARQKLNEAREALAEGDGTRARRLAQQAYIDARVAEVRAEAQTQRQQAVAVEQAIGTTGAGRTLPR